MRCLSLLACLMIPLAVFAQGNARLPLHVFPPDSSHAADSSSVSQIHLVDWLKAAPHSEESSRKVSDGQSPENAAQPPAEMNGGILIPWGSEAVLHWRGEKVDSFLVSASRIGCPGTEVAASVAVSFSTHSGWSSPPIRFGPLGDHSVCPLGQGFELEIFTEDEGPFVQISREGLYWGTRR